MTGRAGKASQRKGNGTAKGNGKGKGTGKAGQAGRHDVLQRHGCRRSQRRVFRRAPSGAPQAPVGRAPEGRAGVQPGMFSRARSFEFHRACFFLDKAGGVGRTAAAGEKPYNSKASSRSPNLRLCFFRNE